MLVFWTVVLSIAAIAAWAYWIHWSKVWWVPKAWKVTFVAGAVFVIAALGRENEPKWGPLWCLMVGMIFILASAILTIAFEVYRQHMYNKTFLLTKPRENRTLHIQAPH